MHSCIPICKLAAPAATRSSTILHFYDQQLNNVVKTINATDFVSTQRHAADNTEGLVREDTNSPVDACGTQTQAQLQLFIDEHGMQVRMLPCIDHLQAHEQMRLCIVCIDADEEDKMQPCCMSARTQYSRSQTAAYNDVSIHAQPAASDSREHPVLHDVHMHTDDRYSDVQEEGLNVGMQSWLPPMSSKLMECIARARVRAARCRGMWTMVQLMSTVSQIMGVVLVLGLCSKEEVLMRSSALRSLHYKTSSPLRAWALGYALGCLAWLPLFCIKRSQSMRSDDLLDIVEWSTPRANRSGGEAGEGGVEKRLRRCVELFMGIWFVVGVVWVFGRPSCAQAPSSPKLYSLCVTLLLLNGLYYLMPLILCCALCCCLQPATTSSRTPNDFDQDGGGKKGATQEIIDATLPVFKFKHRRSITNHLYDESFSTATTTIDERSTCMDGMEYCCVCLKRYKEDAKLRGLPCSHYFHVDCVDKWLKINASCPLCKFSLKANKLHPFSIF